MLIKKITNFMLFICFSYPCFALKNSEVFDCKKYQAQTIKLLESGKSAVGYDLSGGRFGDNLISYLHAKWISYKYHIPLLYYPFEYSSELVLSDAELKATVGNAATLKRYNIDDSEPITKVLFVDTAQIDPNENILYIMPWFPESLQEYERLDLGRPYLYVNWDDENFLKEIRQLVTPRVKLNLLKIPSDKITVAVHIRRNSNGFDLSMSFDQNLQIKEGRQFLDDFYPFKCVNDDFYIESIKKLYELFENKPMYIYIFTDDKDAESITEKYKRLINNSLITIDCRHEKHDHTTHVLEDFFSMLQFDCLIRSDSSYSLVASILGNYKYVISPAGYKLKDKHPSISRINISTKI